MKADVSVQGWFLFHGLSFYFELGSGCSTAVEHMPRDQDVIGSNLCRVLGFHVFYIKKKQDFEIRINSSPISNPITIIC